MLAGLGFRFTIVSPRELGTAVQRLAERLLTFGADGDRQPPPLEKCW